MKELVLKKTDLPDLLAGLAGNFSVFAPAAKNGLVDFHPWPAEVLTEKARTRLSLKRFFLPQKELMFQYSLDQAAVDHDVLQPVLPEGKTLVWGVSSCDARSVGLNGLVFVDDPTNRNKCPYFQARRENTVLIGLACNEPCATCFCHAVGGHPHGEEGLDAQMVDLGDRYLLKVLTDKGRQALAGITLPAALPEDSALARDKAIQARAAMPGGLRVGQAVSQKLMSLFNLPLWAEVAERCLNCGACTFLCPTCYCFDILDEVQGSQGVRFRIWDACMFPLYTLHASGHNPRPSKTERVRNRFMHKLKYFPDRNRQKLSCVGCGRCVVYCPVNIDIREVAARMKVA